MVLQFVSEDADRVIQAIRALADELADQAGARRAAAEAAAADFFGGYAVRFRSVCAAESADRMRLAGACAELAAQVERAKAQANEEREREAAFAEWQARETRREQARLVSAMAIAVTHTIEDLWDPRPSDLPLIPSEISARFSPSERVHLADTPSGGRSSADPMKLREFAHRSAALDRALQLANSAARRSWARFTATCSWVPVAAMTCLDGLHRHLDMNANDAGWVRDIADAFDRAGGGSIADVEISLLVAEKHPRDLEAILLSGDVNAQQIAQAWAALSANPRFRERRFIEAHAFELASLDGVPFRVMDQAGRYALEWALDPAHPERLAEARRRMGFTYADRRTPGPELEAFRGDLLAIRAALISAKDLVPDGDRVQLLGLGSHDGAVTAGVALGDLDRVPSVGVFVSGMASDVHGLPSSLESLAAIRGNLTHLAMVSWIGYRAPSLLEEPSQYRADAGAARLASFLDGISAQRNSASGTTLGHFTVIGHSYGTNVVAQALKRSNPGVDTFISWGSAGLAPGTTAEDFGETRVHATHAEGDPIAASIGQRFHDTAVFVGPRVDPRQLDGASVFSSEVDGGGKAVTMHNLLAPIDLPESLQNLDGITKTQEIGYGHPGSSAVARTREIILEGR